MPWDVIVFYLLAAICILCAGGVVVSNNPVHAGVFLILCFFNVAAIFVMLGAEFLAAVQVIVYTGAILVLVLFVLMLVDPDDLPEFHAARPVQRTVGLLLGAILLLEVGAAILNRTVVGQPGNATPANVAVVGGNVQAVGRMLYTQYLLPFEVISLVLLVGIIGAIVLALPERLGERIGRRQATISLGHPRGTDFALPQGPAAQAPETGPGRPQPTPAPSLVATRELIMVRDADSYTGDGGRASEVGGQSS